MTKRIAGWSLFVVFFSILQYASRFTSGEPPKDFAYQWISSIGGLVEYGIVLGLALLITRGLDRRRVLGLRRPSSWWRALGISVLVMIALLVASALVAPFGNPGREQGLVPSGWDSHRIAQFTAFAIVVTLVGPIVEELMFRGVGYGLLEPFGRTRAIVVVGLAFALIHGLVAGFPVIATFGIGITYLRSRTDSIYPCMLLHASYNALGLALGIAT
ncbi:MAG TPA: type II CAAX endopeptidase family protein [Gaiellaceae bacterium]